MRGFALHIFIFAATFIMSSKSAFSGGLEGLVFSESGLRIFPKLGESVPEGALKLNPRISTSCGQAPQQSCIFWKLAVEQGASVMEILPEILTGFNLWSQDESLRVEFLYNGITHSAGIPYQTVPGSNPPEIVVDDFGNQVIAGNFLVSFLPPGEMVFPPGVVSMTVKYVVPNLEEESANTVWGGIFLNPDYQAGEDYQLERVIAAEAGFLLGLSPSLEMKSILNPQLSEGAQVLALTNDDLQWAREAYASSSAPTNFGKMSGRAINGNNGSPLVGMGVFLIPTSKIEAFSNSGSWNLAEYQAYTDSNGNFHFPRLAPGNYVLAFGSALDWGTPLSFLDDWLSVFADDSQQGIEFYDGAGRESNQEPAFGFSPQMILAAAHIGVVSAVETTNVELISNAEGLGAELISAAGSSNETLMEINFDLEERLKALYESEAGFPTPKKSGGGCSLKLSQSAPGALQTFGLVLMLFILGMAIRAKRRA